MFGSMIKAAVGIAVDVPLSVVADVVTLGGALTDEKQSYTATALSNVMDNVSDAVKPEGK